MGEAKGWERALTVTEARTILFALVFIGLLYALCTNKLTADQFLACLTVDGLLWKLAEKISKPNSNSQSVT